jgi:hypothetical protein
MLFAIENLPYWLFLGMGIALFMLVIFAGGDDDMDMDADLDANLDLDVGSDLDFGDLSDVDIDIDADVDADADIDAESNFSFLAVLRWLGIGKVPLLLLLATDFSVLGILGWSQNVIWGNITGQVPSGFLSAFIFLSSVIISLFVGSLVSRPLGRVFASSSEDSSSDRILGRVGTLSSAAITSDRMGQVDVRDANGNLVTITATVPEWATEEPQWGEKVLIIENDAGCYLVITEGGTDQENWLANASKPPKLPKLKDSG